jgi:glutamate racemase
VYGVLTKTGLLRPDHLPEPRHRFVTTGSPEEFAVIGSRFLGPVLSSVDQFAWIR